MGAVRVLELLAVDSSGTHWNIDEGSDCEDPRGAQNEQNRNHRGGSGGVWE